MYCLLSWNDNLSNPEPNPAPSPTRLLTPAVTPGYAQNRDKFNLIFAERIHPAVKAEEYYDGEDQSQI